MPHEKVNDVLEILKKSIIRLKLKISYLHVYFSPFSEKQEVCRGCCGPFPAVSGKLSGLIDYTIPSLM